MGASLFDTFNKWSENFVAKIYILQNWLVWLAGVGVNR